MSEFARDRRLSPGEVVRGTYTVEETLGSGAFSTVYRVRHRFLGTQAMKVFRTGAAMPSVDAVVGEASILANLLDPHVVRVFEANTLDVMPPEQPYLTMEFVAGGTLEAFLDRTLRLHPLSALKTARQICTGLGAAHRTTPSIVHRDVKPQNILVWAVSPHGTPQVKVGDFGLAKHVDPDSQMTRAAGTLLYLAPEAIWGFHTPASDVYSAAVVLFRMLTGMFPFPLPDDADTSTAANAREAVLRSRQAIPPPPSRFRLGLPTQIDGVVRRALAPESRDRFLDTNVFGAELDRLIGEFS